MEEKLGQATGELITKMGFSNTGKDRVWLHDAIHVISGSTGLDESKEYAYFTDSAEIVSSIWQAVLLREDRVFMTVDNRYGYEIETGIRDFGRMPSYSQVCEMIPKIMEIAFINRQNYQPLSNEEMMRNYILAIRFAEAFHKEYGCHLGEMSKQQIEELPLAKLEELHEKAKSQPMDALAMILGRFNSSNSSQR